VLVTLGAGLVGSHLCDRLLAEGEEVVAVDDLAVGSLGNVWHLLGEPRFVFEEHDLEAPFAADADVFVHLAHDAQAPLGGLVAAARVLEVAAWRRARVVLASPLHPLPAIGAGGAAGVGGAGGY